MPFHWEPDETILANAGWDAYNDAVQTRALALATSALIGLTNNRVGLPPVTLRPCTEPLPCTHPWEPAQFADGMWLNGCACKSARWCKPISEIDLPGPVGYVDEIQVGEVLLDLYDFRIDNGHLLVWQGQGPAPLFEVQDLSRPLGQPGTWGVTYSRSYPEGFDGAIAVALMALEFAKSLVPQKNSKCVLPRGVTTVSRQGVSFTIEAGLFPNGLTGIDLVDQFILRWVPVGSPTRSATVFDPSEVQARTTNRIQIRPEGPYDPYRNLDGGTP